MNNNISTVIYCLPGLAANPQIFKFLRLPSSFSLKFISWIDPQENETIEEYSKRLCLLVKDKHPVLMGVSFGGIMVQEMAKHISCKKVIIVSSVKSKKEFPLHMRFGNKTKAYKLLPTSMINNVENFISFVFGPSARKRMEYHRHYLSVRNPSYLKWAIKELYEWKQSKPDENVIHIHGAYDLVFPIIYIKKCIKVPKGTHVMILTHSRWFNENLPKLITDY